MPANRDLQAAWNYHNATKHSYASIRTNPHTLVWENKPTPFKIYPTLEVSRLPREVSQTGVAALSTVTASCAPASADVVPGLDALAQLLYFSAGITKSKKYPGGETFFRAAACTGALYEIELYVVSGELADLAAGVYHFGVAEFGLRQLRSGDYRQALAEATGNEPALVQAPFIIICTGTYWRNAWKYQARTYRHFGWDNGTILANLLASSSSLGLPAKIICGFADDAVNRLLDLDTQREVAFSMVAIGRDSSTVLQPAGEIKPLGLPLIALSQTETDYPAMREMHEASSLNSADEVIAWRRPVPGSAPPARTGKLAALQVPPEEEWPQDSVEDVIIRRGSSRRFAHEPITLAQFSAILDCSTQGIPADFLEPPGTQLNDIYVVVNDVSGLSTGAYFYRREERALEVLRHGHFRKLAGFLGLEQELAADASAAVFFLADLRKILERFGNRGYRAAQLEAGILGGKMYLAAYAQRLGATGLTFFDDDVVRFFSPHAEGKSAIFLVALGKSAPQKS